MVADSDMSLSLTLSIKQSINLYLMVAKLVSEVAMHDEFG